MMSDFTFTRRDASPADWGAVPVDQPKDGPLAWGAMPVGDKRVAAPPPGFVLDQSFVLDKPIEKSAKVAQLLTSDDLSKVGAGIKILSQRPDLANSIRHADAAISSVLARGSLPATEWEH